ncbi:hypothetical protein FSP39_024067 [Pinctada imbricata]|uniref:Uncharacterized protein n=1 Tax=Pinctada imbricata TaxID=66713 RepID=A0AA89C365_PINIB|nr:hypothetical protein FSP39_024067 [Pinctada imbricata]
MVAKVYFLLFLASHLAMTLCTEIQVDTVNHRSKPSKKLWWLKEVTSDIYIGGRLTSRDIKYISEGGFKSIVSLYFYDEPSKFGDEELPSSAEAAPVAEEAGLQYEIILEPTEEWSTIDTVKKVTDALDHVARPVVVHSDNGYGATFVTLMYLANKTRNDPNFEPKVTSDSFYRTAVAMGYDFTSNQMKRIVAEITGERFVESPPKPNVSVKEWYKYWQAAPVYKNYFTAGQIRKSQIPGIIRAGYKAIIQMRPGVTTDGVPSQESVTLLNVVDGTPTYGDGKSGPRQTPETLRKTRIDPNRENSYISSNAEENFEVTNEEEFGDEIGLNVDTEIEHFKRIGFPLYHMPLGLGRDYTLEDFQKYKDDLIRLGREGPVLVHCAIGMRAGLFAVLAAALQHDKDMQWAQKRIRELGFEVSPSVHSDVYEIYKHWLDKASKHSEL